MNIRQVAAEHFARDAREPVTETTRDEISPEVIAFCKSFGAKAPLFVPVQQDPCGIYGMCFIGVADKIKTGGGSMCHGWAIWETLPRLFLTAEFHAVWVSPRGRANRHYPEAPRRDGYRLCSGPEISRRFRFPQTPQQSPSPDLSTR
jgi:hypothetical protein